MSKPNKVNKTNYVQAGRLTPDDLARERKRQSEVPSREDRVRGKVSDRAPRERGATRPRSAREE